MNQKSRGIQIAVFAFNRPAHLEACLESLKSNPEAINSDLTVFIDGPRNKSDENLVKKVHKIANNVTGFQSVNVVKSRSNKGLASSIISGIDKIFENKSEIVVLEDDLVVSPYFLNFMFAALKKYKNEKNVASIHGYLPDLPSTMNDPFFIRGADCWGWATWRDRWRDTEWDGTKLRQELKSKNLISQFNFDGRYNYFGMLERQIRRENDSWAIRWHASMFLQNRLTLYPNKSLVINAGMDGTGRHSGISQNYDTRLTNSPIYLANIEISESMKAREEFKKYFASNRAQNSKHLLSRLFRKICTKI